jgi:hypothetical protein
MVVKLSVNPVQSRDQSLAEEALNQENDIDLCVLKYGTNGVLEITPDFTNNRRPYTVEVWHINVPRINNSRMIPLIIL